MTVSSVTRKAGPFAGNNSATTFPFSFKVFGKADVKVSVINPSGATTSLTLDSDYSVTLNANQNSTPGGWVTYPLTGAPLAYNYDLVVLGSLPNDQETDITNSGGFYPQVVEDMVDRATIQIQQISEIASRAITVSASESVSPTLPPALSRVNTVLGFDALGNMELYGITPAVGAGDLKNESWTDGQDYTSGTSTTVTLSRKCGTKANLGTVVMAGVAQDPATYDLDGTGTKIVFNATIPAGVGRIWCVGGTTLSVYLPPAGSVGDTQAAPGSKLFNRILGLTEARDEGAVGNSTQDDSAAFASVVPHMFVINSGVGDYLVGTNTTITANLTFLGGSAITVPAGVTLTVNGTIKAPHKVIFKGAGTVIVNQGVIDVAWFDGTDASTKTAFCLRGVANTNGTGKTLAYHTPQPGDAWAVQSPNGQWGYGWKVSAPIALEQTQNYTQYLTYSSFIATVAMDAVFTLGYQGVINNNVAKADGQTFPLRLKVDGGNGLANWAVRIYGSSHSYFPYVEAYYCGGIAFTPQGQMQCSDIQVGFLDTGALYRQAILMDGTNGANNTITDIEIGFVNSTGFSNGHAADSVVKIGSNVNGVTVRKVAHRAVSVGVGGAFQDATQAVVLVTNGGTLGANVVSCRYGVNIGPALNGSLTLTAEAVVVADASGGAAAKMTGITLDAGSQVDGTPPGGATISLNYTSGAIIQGMPGASTTNSAQKIAVNSTCVDTQIYGVTPSQVADAGTNTLINGHNYGAPVAIAAPGSGAAWVNSYHFPVLYQVQAATTITNVVLTRGGVSLTVANSGTAGAWPLLPGDNIAVSYTGAPAFNIIPM